MTVEFQPAFTTSRPPAFRHAFNLASIMLLSLVSRSQQQQSSITVATSVADFKHALDTGARHIELQAHLDLTALPAHPSASDDDPEHFRLLPTTRTIRGNCKDKIPKDFQSLDPPLVTAPTDNCVLLSRHDFITSAASVVWLDQLTIRLVRPDPLPVDEPTTSLLYNFETLYATNLVLQGDDREKCDGMFASNNAYVADSQFSCFDGGRALTVSDNALVSLSSNTFQDNSVTVAVIDVLKGSVWMKDNDFTDNAPADISVGFQDVAYSDNDELVAAEGSSGVVQPLTEVSAGVEELYPSQLDPEFVALQGEVEALQAAGGSLPIPAPQAQAPAPAPAALDSPPPATPATEPEDTVEPIPAACADGSAADDCFASKLTGGEEQSGSDGGASVDGGGGKDDDTAVIAAVSVTAAAVLVVAVIAGFALWRRRANRATAALLPPAESAKTTPGNGGDIPAAGGSWLYQEPVTGQHEVSAVCQEAGALKPLSVSSGSNNKLRGAEPNRSSSGFSLAMTSDPWTSQGGVTAYGSQTARKQTVPTGTSGGESAGEVASRHEIESALDDVLAKQPPERFDGKYVLVGQRAHGGQAVIQFARSYHGGMDQFAIKFFFRAKDYYVESALYSEPAIRKCLPQLFDMSDNRGGGGRTVLKTANGYVFPQYIVVERGVTLDVWARQSRDVLNVLSMFQEMAQHLECLHGAGLVHRDIKPGNVLFMMNSQTWQLIDFGISAQLGSESSPSCTLTYAPPEVLLALESKKEVTVAGAQDVWALGVLVYECLVGESPFQHFDMVEDFYEVASGHRRYVWEDEATISPAVANLRCREALMACLTRDPTKRPTADRLVYMIKRLGNVTTLAS